MADDAGCGVIIARISSPRGSRLSWLGLAVSLLAVAGVVWWASRQDPPELPSSGSELAALIGAIALYGLATVVRAERWQRLLVDERAVPARVDTYALTCVGYMGNNVLPARAGDAIRTVLMAPRAGTSMRTVVGTLVAERILDIAVLVVVFVVVGYGLLGEVGGDKVEIILLAAAGLAAAGFVAYRIVRRNEKLLAFIAPMASATLGLRRAHHGLLLLGMTLLIWAIEAGVWMSAAACVGFGMDPIEGLYIVALASVFSMIPSGPAYAGTQDAAAILGIKALGGTGAQAVAYIVMLRFIIVVPITLVGLVLLAARYGGLGRLRVARAQTGG
ncbi:MAG TPA: lysylphosphatidylglycerol synthase transmembrane domain-containing protein [Solirubrobacteraceae bacterium]|jgi:glycosyltransferase 2 family protein